MGIDCYLMFSEIPRGEKRQLCYLMISKQCILSRNEINERATEIHRFQNVISAIKRGVS
jgi:hypothetical protein